MYVKAVDYSAADGVVSGCYSAGGDVSAIAGVNECDYAVSSYGVGGSAVVCVADAYC